MVLLALLWRGIWSPLENPLLLAVDGAVTLAMVSLTVALFSRNYAGEELVVIGNAHMLSCLAIADLTLVRNLGLLGTIGVAASAVVFVSPIFLMRNLRTSRATKLVWRAVITRW